MIRQTYGDGGAVDTDAYNQAKDYSNGVQWNADGAMEGLNIITKHLYDNVTGANGETLTAMGVTGTRKTIPEQLGYDADSLAGVGIWYCSSPTSWANNALVYMNIIFKDFVAQYCRGGGDILAVCEEITRTFIERNGHYSTQWDKLIHNDIEKCYNESQYICCATYVSMVLYKAGLLTAEQINSYGYHSTYAEGIPAMLKAAGWTQVTAGEIQPGDVVNDETVHVLIYAGNGQFWDQTSAVVSSYGTPPTGTTCTYNLSGCQIWRAP